MGKKTQNTFFLLGLIFLVGCTNQSPGRVIMTPTLTYSPQNQSTNKAISPTISPQAMDTPMPSTTPTRWTTPTQTPVLPTLTPLSTLSPEQADEKVQTLLRENAGCQFPCWWGITPGKVAWSEAAHFLKSFTEITPHPKFDVNAPPPDKVTYYVIYSLGGFRVSVEKDQVDIIFVGDDSTIFDLTLSQVLSKYGQPYRIFLKTFEHIPGDEYPFILVLDYSHQNFLVKYDLIAHEDHEENDVLVSCPSTENPSLYFWSEEESVSDQRIQDWTLGVDPFTPLKPLEQVTDWDIATFTDSFSKDDAGTQCIHTQREFWSSGN